MDIQEISAYATLTKIIIDGINGIKSLMKDKKDVKTRTHASYEKLLSDCIIPIYSKSLIDIISIASDNEQMIAFEDLVKCYFKICAYCAEVETGYYSQETLANLDAKILTSEMFYKKMTLLCSLLREENSEVYSSFAHYKNLILTMINEDGLQQIPEYNLDDITPTIARNIFKEICTKIDKNCSIKVMDTFKIDKLDEEKAIEFINKDTQFSKLDLTNVCEDSGIIVWKINDKIKYINSTGNLKKYMNYISAISPSRCYKNSKSLNFVKLNRFITNKGEKIKYDFIKTSHYKALKYYLDEFMQTQNLDFE